MKKKKSLETLVTNLILIVIICGMFFLAFTSGVKSVFNVGSVEAVYRGNAKENKISLMINVYWGTEFIEPMLQVLTDNNVKATFFVGGTWAAQNSDILKKIYDQGHEIGNHGYYHKDHKLLSSERNQEEIYITHKLVKETIGIDMTLFAPPSGSYNQTTLEIAADLIYGGTFNMPVGNANRITIYNGTFNSSVSGYMSSIYVYDGTFNGLVYANYGLHASNGTFNGKVDICVEGSIAGGIFTEFASIIVDDFSLTPTNCTINCDITLKRTGTVTMGEGVTFTGEIIQG